MFKKLLLKKKSYSLQIGVMYFAKLMGDFTFVLQFTLKSCFVQSEGKKRGRD